MFKISLGKEKFAVVDKDFSHLSQWNWNLHSAGYASRSYQKLDKSTGTILMHHAIIGFPLNGLQIDHINGNRLDNRRSNLRIVTRRENQSNMRCHRNGKKSSKFIGVSWDAYNERWKSQISIDGKYKHIGYFKNEEDASKSYQTFLLTNSGSSSMLRAWKTKSSREKVVAKSANQSSGKLKKTSSLGKLSKMKFAFIGTN